ncbi:hypothetical protein [Streptomyces sp. NPDC047315]|uniref:hypothetical protein n=1 Tax=Streptomyces sp. NPDC047315 TaxID=3155142 RepID=UPI003411CF55
MSAAEHLREAIDVGCTRDDHDHIADHAAEVRAAALLEAAETADTEAARLYDDMGQKAAEGARAVAERLLAMAGAPPAAEPVTIPPAVAEHILWHALGDQAGYPPGDFVRQLLTAWDAADAEHAARLAAAYPAYGAARDLAAATDGRDRLRQISAAAAQGGDAG